VTSSARDVFEVPDRSLAVPVRSAAAVDSAGFLSSAASSSEDDLEVPGRSFAVPVRSAAAVGSNALRTDADDAHSAILSDSDHSSDSDSSVHAGMNPPPRTFASSSGQLISAGSRQTGQTTVGGVQFGNNHDEKYAAGVFAEAKSVPYQPLRKPNR
jgi:hypothetical protein